MPSPITAQTVDQVYEAIVSAFKTDMDTNQPAVALAWENVKFDPDDEFPTYGESDSFVRLNMQHVPGESGVQD